MAEKIFGFIFTFFFFFCWEKKRKTKYNQKYLKDCHPFPSNLNFVYLKQLKSNAFLEKSSTDMRAVAT